MKPLFSKIKFQQAASNVTASGVIFVTYTALISPRNKLKQRVPGDVLLSLFELLNCMGVRINMKYD
jgi:hypothetical protein